MRCNKCGGQTRVMETRSSEQRSIKVDEDMHEYVYRRHRCKRCDNRFTTCEARVESINGLVKSNKRKQSIINQLKQLLKDIEELV